MARDSRSAAAESRRAASPGPRREGWSAASETLLGDREFARFQALIQREAGIWLVPEKRALLVGRLSRRVKDLGLASLAAYYERVEEDAIERVHMLDRITTNETHFFREPHHFEFLDREVFPRWRAQAEAGRRPRRVRAWSAACSTGEEPFTLAMSLLRAFPEGAGWDLEILATDLSTRVLEQAKEAIWPVEKAREIPVAELKAFMLRGTGPQEGFMKAGPELRRIIRFARVNLIDPAFPSLGQFDLVFCRNVLIYFDAPTKERVVSRVLSHLTADGYLFLGHAESLSGMSLAARCVRPTIYSHGLAPVHRSGGGRC
jgi:chemotaxis protein methyltransferase CheR